MSSPSAEVRYRKGPIVIEFTTFYPCKPDIFEATYEAVA